MPTHYPLLLEGGFFADRRPLFAEDPVEVAVWKDCPQRRNPFQEGEALLQAYRAKGFEGIAFVLLGFGLRHAVEKLPAVGVSSPEPDLLLALYPSKNLRSLEESSKFQTPSSPLKIGPITFPDADRFRRNVLTVQEHIHAGNCYQANLTHPFSASFEGDPFDLYKRLRTPQPAPLGVYFDAGAFQVASVSPESFLEWQGKEVVTRPIKGTRPRARLPPEDEALAAELWHSAKDRAELTMIVDLMRNDLGRVAETGSVTAPEICRLETFPQIHHLVGEVRARLRPEAGLMEWWAPLFPGGSISGAPKIRALEILAGLEERERGLYTGCAGWVDMCGNGHLNMLIRTFVVRGSTLEYWAGGGITGDSDPEAEYQETLAKARPLLELRQE